MVISRSYLLCFSFEESMNTDQENDECQRLQQLLTEIEKRCLQIEKRLSVFASDQSYEEVEG